MMTVAHWMLLLGGLMPYAIVFTAKATRQYDNADPRRPDNFVGWRARAHAAHANALEAFPLFAAAVLLATLRGADAAFVDGAAIVWVFARAAYWWCYVKGRAALRSLTWFAGTFAALAIFIAALVA